MIQCEHVKKEYGRNGILIKNIHKEQDFTERIKRAHTISVNFNQHVKSNVIW